MSDEVFSVMTPFGDVASLAQGYLNRADGERLLLPLPLERAPRAGVRFVVYLADGTPAFAGAGLCVQASDQGDTVPPDQRFETLLDALQFDERSRPVYDYIVAVRNAAYAQQAEQGTTDAGEMVDEAAGAAELQAAEGEVAGDEPTELMSASDALLQDAGPDAGSGYAVEVEAASVASGYMDPSGQASMAELSVAAAAVQLSPEAPAELSPEALALRQPSFVPPPIPTGLLTRPARTMHWQPGPPRRPTPRPATGLFRYGAGGLPQPARPPRPDLDPALRVAPAPR